ARERAGAHADPVLTGQIEGAEGELAQSLAELRELARGIHPAVLTQAGLSAGVMALADRCSVPTHVAAVPEGRFAPHIESAAYFVVSEALTNAAKHSHASLVTILLTHDGPHLVIAVSDDGIGGAAFGGSGGRSGLNGLKD